MSWFPAPVGGFIFWRKFKILRGALNLRFFSLLNFFREVKVVDTLCQEYPFSGWGWKTAISFSVAMDGRQYDPLCGYPPKFLVEFYFPSSKGVKNVLCSWSECSSRLWTWLTTPVMWNRGPVAMRHPWTCSWCFFSLPNGEILFYRWTSLEAGCQPQFPLPPERGHQFEAIVPRFIPIFFYSGFSLDWLGIFFGGRGAHFIQELLAPPFNFAQTRQDVGPLPTTATVASQYVDQRYRQLRVEASTTGERGERVLSQFPYLRVLDPSHHFPRSCGRWFGNSSEVQEDDVNGAGPVSQW